MNPSCAIRIAEFLRNYPLLDVALLLLVEIPMYRAWKKAGHDPAEQDPNMREIAATVITNQINTSITGASIILAGIGAVLAIGFEKNLPPALFSHMSYAALWSLLVIVLGIYVLGYISSPSVIHRIAVTRKTAVQLTALAQLTFIVLSVARFLLGLRHLL